MVAFMKKKIRAKKFLKTYSNIFEKSRILEIHDLFVHDFYIMIHNAVNCITRPSDISNIKKITFVEIIEFLNTVNVLHKVPNTYSKITKYSTSLGPTVSEVFF